MTSAVSRACTVSKPFRTAAVLSIPYVLFFLTFSFLLLIYGGHRRAFLQSNPFCSIPSPPHGNTPPRLVLHASDFHVSDGYKGSSKEVLQSFRTQSLPKWAPFSSALLITGDLVNSAIKQPYPLGKKSKQIHAEWSWLQSFASSVNESVLWKAVPGNHDSFGGYNPDHFVYSCAVPLVANDTRRVDEYVREGKPPLSLYGIDATLPRPLHRPLNFFGDAEEASAQLDGMLGSYNEQRDVLVYGHYPSSIMKNGERVHLVALSGRPEKRKKPRFSAYLSGHLHTLYGLTKNGLQAVSLSGSLELQVPDMVQSRTYRVILFDSGYLSFKDLLVGKDEGLEQVVVMNPPRAGLCSAGAGYSALRSTHVRIFSVELNLVDLGARVSINGDDLGPLSRLPCAFEENEDPATSTCNHVYGVEWDPSQYASGTHELLIHVSEEEKSATFVFSLDGSPEKDWVPWMERALGAMFALSDFGTMAKFLVGIALLLCLFASSYGILRRSTISAALALLAFVLFLGPMLIVRDIIDGEPGWSFIGLHYMYMPTGVHSAGIDASYLLSTAVVWRSFLPFCFLDALVHRGRMSGFCRRTLFGFLLVYLYGSFSWSLNIWGAHGFLECIISPSCLPLTTTCILAARKAWASTEIATH